VTALATSWQGLLPVMQRLGMVGATLDLALFAEFAKSFSTLDFDLYGATMQALGRHDAHDVLPTIDVPFTLVTGDRDMLTPLTTARAVQAKVPHARLRVLPGGTHYTPVEYPAEVCEELERLFLEADSAEAKRCAG
jgi:pimeloyl-ACP methyl ester carboxylesterase